MHKVLFIRNDMKEDPGQLGRLITIRGYDQSEFPAWKADYAASDPADFSGLIVLGGAQSTCETDTYPYLADEIKLIQAFFDAGLPVIGLCLGAQHRGSMVRQTDQKELGWFEISITEVGQKDALMKHHPASAFAFHFHGDYCETPPGCECLASSALTQCQLFRFEDNVYGFQYHVEVDYQLIEAMCKNNVDYMADNCVDMQEVLNQSLVRIDDYIIRSGKVLNAWLDTLERAA